MKDEKLYTCASCGSHNVQQKAWVSLNNNTDIDFIETSDKEDLWCVDCEKHVHILINKPKDDKNRNTE